MRYKKISGLTLMEICVVMFIFSFFLIAFYAAMNFGLKAWKIAEVRSDLKVTAAWVLKRMIAELENANSIAIQTCATSDPNLSSYICFETPVYNGEIQHDSGSGKLLWQGHIIYYDIKDNEDNIFNRKILYRRYVPHNKTSPYKSDNRFLATFLSDISNYTDDRSLSSAEENEGQILKKLCDKIKSITLYEAYGMVDIELNFQENFRKSKDARVSFSAGGNDKSGTEVYSLKGSVKPRN
ncbi:MAG: hypothetical protein ABRQ39_31455 [Candidatus Eremiobacterota bacterium]